MIMTLNGVQLPLVIKNGLSYLEHNYPTVKQMKEITRKEFMTSKNTWVPTKLGDVERATDLSISQFFPVPLNVIDSFYNNQGDIRATKRDLEVDPIVVGKKSESEVGPVVVDKDNERYRPKPPGIKSEGYRSKPKTKKKRNTQKWINNKKIR